MKILILSILPERDVVEDYPIKTFLKSSFLNPFNYVRILGLMILIASNVFSSKLFNVPWIDAALFEDADSFIKEVDQKELIGKVIVLN